MYNKEEFLENKKNIMKVEKVYNQLFHVLKKNFKKIDSKEVMLIFNCIAYFTSDAICYSLSREKECFLQKRLYLLKDMHDSIAEIILNVTANGK